MSSIFISVFFTIFFQCSEVLDATKRTMTPRYQTIQHRDTATFNCYLLGDWYRDRVDWIFNGTRLTSNFKTITDRKDLEIKYRRYTVEGLYETDSTLVIKSVRYGIDNGTYTCEFDNGYQLKGKLDVTRRSCRAPVVDERTILKLGKRPNYTFEDTVSFTCMYGYRIINGSFSITCQEDGKWNGSTLVCERISCGTPSLQPNAVVDVNNTWVGDIAHFACKPGFEPSGGNSSRTCGVEGQWNGTDLLCATGNWLEWSALTDCSATCGKGMRVSRRQCSFQGEITNLTRCPGYHSTFIACKAPISCTIVEEQKKGQEFFFRHGYVNLVESRSTWYWFWSVIVVSGMFMFLWYSRDLYLQEGLRIRKLATREFDYIILRIAAMMMGDKKLQQTTLKCTKAIDRKQLSEYYKYVSRQLNKSATLRGSIFRSVSDVRRSQPLVKIKVFLDTETPSVTPGPPKISPFPTSFENLFRAALEETTDADNLDNFMRTCRPPVRSGTSSAKAVSRNFLSPLSPAVTSPASFKATFSQIRDYKRTQVRKILPGPSLLKIPRINQVQPLSQCASSKKGESARPQTTKPALTLTAPVNL